MFCLTVALIVCLTVAVAYCSASRFTWTFSDVCDMKESVCLFRLTGSNFEGTFVRVRRSFVVTHRLVFIRAKRGANVGL
jgi:hypothetical protein